MMRSNSSLDEFFSADQDQSNQDLSYPNFNHFSSPSPDHHHHHHSSSSSTLTPPTLSNQNPFHSIHQSVLFPQFNLSSSPTQSSEPIITNPAFNLWPPTFHQTRKSSDSARYPKQPPQSNHQTFNIIENNQHQYNSLKQHIHHQFHSTPIEHLQSNHHSKFKLINHNHEQQQSIDFQSPINHNKPNQILNSSTTTTAAPEESGHKSVDYVKHLVRTRSEMTEDIEELKALIKHRVDGGQILILEWEESINAKATERERARLADQTIIDEEPDEDEEIINKSTKKRKPTEMRINNVNVGNKRLNNNGFKKLNQSIDLVDELEGLSNHKFHSVPIAPYPSELTGIHNQFGQNLQNHHHPFAIPPTNMLAVSIGISFAAGSAFRYYYHPTTFNSPTAHTTYPDECAFLLDHHTSPNSIFRASIETISMASIIFLIIILLRPELLLSFLSPTRIGRKKKKKVIALDGDEDEQTQAEMGISDWIRDIKSRVLGPSIRSEELDTEIKELMKLAEIESLLDFPHRRSVCYRVLTALKLYRAIDYNVQLQPRLIAVLSLYIRTLLGPSNLLSARLWARARASRSISTDSFVREALEADFEEACALLTPDSSSGSCAPEVLNRIVERRCEIELIKIWSRILVSTMKKTSPVERPTDKLGRGFRLDHLNSLPTKIEEAGDAYALQVSAARLVVEESLEKISLLISNSKSQVALIAKLTKGVWGLAFDNSDLALEISKEFIENHDHEIHNIEALTAFLNLVNLQHNIFSSKEEDVEKEESLMEMTTLDKLATITISWLSVRRNYLILNVLPNQTWWKSNNGNHDDTSINDDIIELKKLIKEVRKLKNLL
ncbi:hypothetical protein CROQUDRAFT_716359, partial [Cronartium quercuum f. sp. fusiforme G11]